jgi:uncharacterized protein (DUF433 family)
MEKSFKININKYISVDPNICHGKLVFKGTRIMVGLILNMLAAGETIEEILNDYPTLNRKHIDSALAYAAEITGSGQLATLHS